MKRKPVKKVKKKAQVDVKTSSVNLFLNIIIFFLSAIVIFLVYSLFIKITDRNKIIEENNKKQTASEIIQIEVLNGCGVAGVADRFTDYLREHHFDVVNVSNYKSFNITETLVVDRIGNLANAEKVAEELGIDESNVIQQLNENYFLDVTLIVGKDYYKLKPINEDN